MLRREWMFKLYFVSVVIFSCIPLHSEIKPFTGEYTYDFGENETLLDAKKLAGQRAKAAAAEKAGVYVVSNTHVEGGVLIEDFIKTYCTTKMNLVSESFTYAVNTGRIQVLAVSTVTIDTDELNRQIDTLMRNSTAVRELRQLEINNESLRTEVNRLTGLLNSASDEEDILRIAKARNRLIRDGQVNDRLAEAWIALAGNEAGVLVGGSSSIEGREHAKRALEEAIRIDSTNAEARRTLGIVLMEESQHRQAEAAFRAAVQFDSSNARNHYALGLALAQERKQDEAIRAFSKAVEIDTSYWLAYNMLGAAYYEKGDLEHAATQFERTLALKPDHAGARYNLGMCHLSTGNDRAALDDFTRYLETTNKAPAENLFFSIADSVVSAIRARLGK